MKDLVVYGHVSIDVIAEVDPGSYKRRYATNHRYLDSYVREYGGLGANLAVVAQRLGLKTGIFNQVGDDLMGRMYYRYLKDLGIDVSGLKFVSEATSRCIVLVNRFKRRSVLYFFEGAGKIFRQPKVSWLNNFRHLHIVGKDSKANLTLTKNFKGTISFDPGVCLNNISKEELKEILERCQILMANNKEIKCLVKLFHCDDFTALHKFGPKLILMSFTDKGCLLSNQGQIVNLPPIGSMHKAGEIVGSGDGLRAGFLTAYLQGYAPEEAAKIGSIVAFYALQQVGCQTNIPTREKVLEDYKRLTKEHFWE